MIAGMTILEFTVLHVAISLIALISGGFVIAGMLTNRLTSGSSLVFLATILATSVTGFMFPVTIIGPPQIVGAISLLDLAIAIPALYVFRLRRYSRPIFVVTATLALYLNAFVFVAQAFDKDPDLHALAPTGSEPPFLIAQAAVLLLFLILGVLALKRFRGKG